MWLERQRKVRTRCELSEEESLPIVVVQGNFEALKRETWAAGMMRGEVKTVFIRSSGALGDEHNFVALWGHLLGDSAESDQGGHSLVINDVKRKLLKSSFSGSSQSRCSELALSHCCFIRYEGPTPKFGRISISLPTCVPSCIVLSFRYLFIGIHVNVASIWLKITEMSRMDILIITL